MWCLPKDDSKAVITAQDQIHSAHRECHLQLPETAILFFMGKATDYLISQYNATELPEPLPRFLNSCPIWEIGKFQLCFADGGRGAPQAVDTIETLAALGVKILFPPECAEHMMKSSMSVKLSLRKRLLWKKEHHFIITRTSNIQSRTVTFKSCHIFAWHTQPFYCLDRCRISSDVV